MGKEVLTYRSCAVMIIARHGSYALPSISLKKDRVILARIKHVLGCGTLRERKDGVVYYEVTNLRALQEVIIPFFKRFGFLSATKKRNFSIFAQIVDEMGKGSHLSKDGLKRIMLLRERLNEGHGRKRKYELQDVC